MKSAPKIRKKIEFEVFIKTLKNGSIGHWSDIAEAIGVDKDTITEWKKHPVAKKAHSEALQYALEQMEKAGASDWRMWEAKIKMLGIVKDKKYENSDLEKLPNGMVIFKPEKNPTIVFDESLKQ